MKIINEQRSNKRYELHCPVIFGQSYGLSRDISSSSIYFMTQNVLNNNEIISLTIQTSQHVNIQCEGEVVRIDSYPEAYGIAIQFTHFMFDIEAPVIN